MGGEVNGYGLKVEWGGESERKVGSEGGGVGGEMG